MRRRRPAVLVAAMAVLPALAGAQAVGTWRPASAARAAPATYAVPDGEVAMTIRCAPSRGYVEQVFTLRGRSTSLPPRTGTGAWWTSPSPTGPSAARAA